MAKAGSVAVFGDTINIAAGTYASTVQCRILPGVSVIGSGTATTILKCLVGCYADNYISAITDAAGAVISDFTINGAGVIDVGVNLTSLSNVTVERVSVLSTIQAGIVALGAYSAVPPLYCDNVKILNCSLTNTSRDEAGFSVGALRCGYLSNSEIAYNTINEDEGYGIKQIASGFFKSLWVHHNTVNVPQVDPLWGSDISIELWDLYDDCIVEHNTVNSWISIVAGNKGSGTYSVICRKNKITGGVGNVKEGIEFTISDGLCENNTIKSCGRGFYIGADVTTSNTLIQLNSVVACNGFGMQIDGKSSNLKVRNNTFVGSVGAFILVSADTSLYLTANLFTGSTVEMVRMIRNTGGPPLLVVADRNAAPSQSTRFLEYGSAVSEYYDTNQKLNRLEFISQ
jgi:hypothetical protein